MRTHFFFSLGYFGQNKSPQYAAYRWRATPDAGTWRRRFVLPALLEGGSPLPVPRDACFHLIPTKEVLSETGTGPMLLADLEGTPWESAVREALEASRDHVLVARDAGAIWRVVDRVLSTVEDGDSVFIDLTNGIRSITTGLLLAAGLVRALRPTAQIVALPYAELDRSIGDPGPEAKLGDLENSACALIEDLEPFLGLFEWASAVRSLGEQLEPGPVLQLLEAPRRELSRSKHEGRTAPDASEADLQGANALKALSTGVRLGWPRVIDRAAASFGAVLLRQDGLGTALSGESTPAAGHVLAHSLDVLGPLLKRKAKADALDIGRLVADLDLVDRFAEAGKAANALQLLREWLVNAQLLATDCAARWLELSERSRAEDALRQAFNARSEVGELWRSVGQLRNALSHCGFNGDATQKESTVLAGLTTSRQRARALLQPVADTDGGAASLRVDCFAPLSAEAPPTFLTNAFSLNMLGRTEWDKLNATFRRISLDEARALAVDVPSAVGHADTAALFSALLEREVACQRQSVVLHAGNRILVGQYVGERLPAGATSLPAGAEVFWFEVAVDA